MIRSVAIRAYTPARGFLEEVGDMMVLAGRTIVSAIRPPFPYGGELVSQFLFTLRLVWFPLLVTTVAIDYGAPGLQAANFLTIFGALDRLGGFIVLASIREIGPLITSIVIAGVAGTSITADLGARKVREELDALQVLGVDPVKNLVVPRFLALVVATGLFDIYALLFGIFGGMLAEIVNGGSLGPFWATLFALESEHSVRVPAADVFPTLRGAPGLGPRLLSVAELEAVRAGLVRRLAAVQAAFDEADGDSDKGGGRRARDAEGTKPKKRSAPAPVRPRRRPPRAGLAGA